VNEGREHRSERLLISSVFDALGEDVFSNLSVLDRLRVAQQGFAGMNSEERTFNRIEGALE